MQGSRSLPGPARRPLLPAVGESLVSGNEALKAEADALADIVADLHLRSQELNTRKQLVLQNPARFLVENELMTLLRRLGSAPGGAPAESRAARALSVSLSGRHEVRAAAPRPLCSPMSRGITVLHFPHDAPFLPRPAVGPAPAHRAQPPWHERLASQRPGRRPRSLRQRPAVVRGGFRAPAALADPLARSGRGQAAHGERGWGGAGWGRGGWGERRCGVARRRRQGLRSWHVAP